MIGLNPLMAGSWLPCWGPALRWLESLPGGQAKGLVLTGVGNCRQPCGDGSVFGSRRQAVGETSASLAGATTAWKGAGDGAST